MKKEASISVLSAKEIKKHIEDKFSPFKFTTKVRGGKVEIYIETKHEEDGFEVVTPYRLNEDDILEAAKEILADKKIKTDNVSIKTEHVPGDYGEPLDYGTDKFVGVRFEWSYENTPS